MKKTERLVSAAVLAAALAVEAGCSDDSSGQIACRVADPRTNQVRIVHVDANATCPPASTVRTLAHAAGPGFAGWYYFGGQSYYGPLPRGARAATPSEAQWLQQREADRENDVIEENRASVRSASRAGGGEGDGEGERGGFGESGAHGGFGG